MIALRTQQVLMEETGVTNVVDPLGGSWFVETLTDQVEAEAEKLFDENQGARWRRHDDGRHLARHRKRLVQRPDRRRCLPPAGRGRVGERRVVGVNVLHRGVRPALEVMRVSHEVEREQSPLWVPGVRRAIKRRSMHRCRLCSRLRAPTAIWCRRCSTPPAPKPPSARSAACSSPSGGDTPKRPRGEPPAHAITVRQTGRMTLGDLARGRSMPVNQLPLTACRSSAALFSARRIT